MDESNQSKIQHACLGSKRIDLMYESSQKNNNRYEGLHFETVLRFYVFFLLSKTDFLKLSLYAHNLQLYT